MTQPSLIGGRPSLPPPGSETQELLIARFRSRASGLFLSAVILIVTAGAVAFYADNLPDPFENWMLFAVAIVVILLVVIAPFLTWLSRRYSITTRRVVASEGVLSRHRREVSHARGYTVRLSRGPLQRLWGAGTLALSNGVEPALILKNVPNVRLVHEVLVDQVEINQILAHRDAQNMAF